MSRGEAKNLGVARLNFEPCSQHVQCKLSDVIIPIILFLDSFSPPAPIILLKVAVLIGLNGPRISGTVPYFRSMVPGP